MKRHLIVCLALFGSACGPGPELGGARFSTNSDRDALAERLRLRFDPVQIERPAGALELSGTSSVTLTLVADVAAPTVGGVALQATSVSVQGSLAFISYARAGAAHVGAVDVIDLSNEAVPVLVSQATFPDADVNDVYEDGGTVYVAVAGESLPFNETAAIQTLTHTAGTLSGSLSASAPLPSFVATSVMSTGSAVYATSGDAGGLTQFDETTFTETASALANDARWVDNETGARPVVHGRDRIYVYDGSLALQDTWTFTSSLDAGAKSKLFVAGGKAFVTAGGEGVHVISTDSGTIHQTIAPPDALALGVDPSFVVANAVTWRGASMFTAFGGAGVYVSRSTSALDANGAEIHDNLATFGSLGLDDLESANDIDLDGNHLVIASGNGGVKIVLVADERTFVDTSIMSGFSLSTHTADAGAPGLYWFDLDEDGDLDVIAFGDDARVLHNDGDGTFTEVQSLGWRKRDAAVCDFDNDGDIDFYHNDSNLFLNDGTGSFSNEGAAGVTSPANEEGIGCVDANSDGWADFVLFAWSGTALGENQGVSPVAFTQLGAGATGLTSRNGNYLATGDFNDDGNLDLVWDNDLSGIVYLGTGVSTFTATTGTGIAFAGNRKVGFMFADYDNDDDLDLYYPGRINGASDLLFRNDGGTFSQQQVAAGLVEDGPHTSVDLGDIDNDGDLDVYLSCRDCPNVLYLNDGDGTFTPANWAGFDFEGPTDNASLVDYDGDGDLDVALVIEGGNNVMLRNESNNPNYLAVKVIGRGAGGTPSSGTGVPVRLYAADGTTFLARRDIAVQRGMSAVPQFAHFGGVIGTDTYVVKAAFATGTVTSTIVPNTVTSTIGGNVIPKLLTISEP